MPRNRKTKRNESKKSVGLTDKDRSVLAKQILDNPVFEEIMLNMEDTAMETVINAAPSDDATRSVAAAEVRAIRKFRKSCEDSLVKAVSKKVAPA